MNWGEFNKFTFAPQEPFVDTVKFAKAAARLKREHIRIPEYLRSRTETLVALGSDDERAQYLINLFYQRKLSGTYVQKQFKRLKPILCPTTTIVPNLFLFERQNLGQQRIASLGRIQQLQEYLIQRLSHDPKVIPILFCFHTGLRMSELLRISTSHLQALARHASSITLRRKTTSSWTVVYYPAFDEFVQSLIQQHYRDEYAYFLETGIDLPLFSIGSTGLLARIKRYYVEATREIPPLGFGLHSIRYFLASTLVAQGEEETARQLLGHASLDTTNVYVRADASMLQRKLAGIIYA